MNEYILKETTVTCKHKYASDKQYKAFMFSYKGKAVSMPVARLVMAWTKGEVPDGYDVDHKNNDPFDNDPDNLQIISHADNLRKMYEDTGSKTHNQWIYNE